MVNHGDWWKSEFKEENVRSALSKYNKKIENILRQGPPVDDPWVEEKSQEIKEYEKVPGILFAVWASGCLMAFVMGILFRID